MFSDCQNILFSTPLNTAFNIRRMKEHPTYARLLEAAAELRGLKTAAEVARWLGVLDQHLTNWKTRGVPKNSIMDIAEKLECNPYWLRDGKGMMSTSLYGLTKQQAVVLKVMEKMPGGDQDRLVKISYTFAESEGENGDGHTPPKQVRK